MLVLSSVMKTDLTRDGRTKKVITKRMLCVFSTASHVLKVFICVLTQRYSPFFTLSGGTMDAAKKVNSDHRRGIEVVSYRLVFHVYIGMMTICSE